MGGGFGQQRIVPASKAGWIVAYGAWPNP